MARIFTKPETQAAAKAWMHDVMVIAGILPKSQRTENEVYFTRYHNVPAAAAGTICDELIKRDFANIDAAILKITAYEFNPSFTRGSKPKQFSAESIAKAIVYTAELLNLYWDDTIRTPYEIDAFKQTILGDAVYRYGRYISAIKDAPAKKPAAASNTGTPQVAQSTSKPKNDFRQQGPKSSQATGLIGLDGSPIPQGQSGEKVFIDKGYALAIRGTFAGKTSPARAVITPLNSKGVVGSKNKVFINASHGYGVGECLFDEMDDAVNFYDQIVLNNRVPSDVTNLQIVKIKVDSNGYFLADTEFGICAIAARVLNEDVEEQTAPVEEDLGSGWRKATEGYTREELNELHDWMRQD
jgi:hypothetical protein